MIEIVPYQPCWSAEFRAIGTALRTTLDNLALRIDHIGSTSVPGLAAKDRIDIQVTVATLSPLVEEAFNRLGYHRSVHNTCDHIPPGSLEPPERWIKWFFNPPTTQRPTNVHVRILGFPNERYPILFRDYLRANPPTALAYALTKQALAKYHADNVDAYYEVKDPVCDLIMAGAELWAEKTSWRPGLSDC